MEAIFFYTFYLAMTALRSQALHSTEGKMGVQQSVHFNAGNEMFGELFEELNIPQGDINGELEDEGFFKVGQAQVTGQNSTGL